MNPGKKRDVAVQVFDNDLLQYFMENSFPVSADSRKDIALRSGVFIDLMSKEGSLSALIKISDDSLAQQIAMLNSSKVEISNGISSNETNYNL